jgi:hypothetical protein
MMDRQAAINFLQSWLDGPPDKRQEESLKKVMEYLKGEDTTCLKKELSDEKRKRLCSCCLGKPINEKPCICKGTGTQEGELQGFREALYDEQAAHQSTREFLRLTYTENEARLQAEMEHLKEAIVMLNTCQRKGAEIHRKMEYKLSRCHEAMNLAKAVLTQVQYSFTLEGIKSHNTNKAITTLEEVLKEKP